MFRNRKIFGDQKSFEVNPQFNADNYKKKDTSIISIVNQKGGCGKTTTCINLSAYLANQGYKVLTIDIDPQAHTSLGLGLDVDNLAHSIYDVITRDMELDYVIVPSQIKNLDIAPAISLLTGAQIEISDLLGRERILKTAIYKMVNTNFRNYDYILIDCSPSLNIVTINGLVTADSLIVPVQTQYFSLEGMKELFSTINLVRERLSSDLNVLGILPTMFDKRLKMNKEMLRQIRDYFQDKVFDTAIRMNSKLSEAVLSKESIFKYAPRSRGAQDYSSLGQEVLERVKKYQTI
ncbi:MAG: AAA family ATPase [Candidatus Omnitrophica bacterium]|nr:AAA family ATPase [Candidatus Omnitrophota bacterium]MCF7888249.1 AAA family ATPase [Candidatus Omnitrophota bacterium]